jgi:hypothetical protein
MDHDASFEVFGQRRPTVFISPGWWLLGRGSQRGATFAPVPKSVLEGRIEFGLEFGALGAQLLEFGAQLPNHRLERGDVVRQRGIGSKRGGVHATFNTAHAEG